MLKCEHCGDSIFGQRCSICGQELKSECMDCHKEIAHDIIKIQNVHIIGGGRHLCSADEDPDAYSPSWKADN